MRYQETGQKNSRSRGDVVPLISALLFPHFLTLCLVICIALIESVLLAQAPNNVYEIGTIALLLVPLWTSWFWLTVGWGIWFLAILLSFFPRFLPLWARGAVRLLLLGVTSIILFIYLGSWGLYFRTGRFASIESIRFFMAIIDNNWLHLYLIHSEKTVLITIGFLMVFFVVLFSFFLRKAGDPGWLFDSLHITDRSHRIVWYSLSILWMILFLIISTDNNVNRRLPRMLMLQYKVNPVVTLLATGLESFGEEWIEPYKEPSELHPISPEVWHPPDLAGERPPSVIFVAIESLRHDVVHLVHQGIEVMPYLNILARNGLHLTRAYAQSTHSNYSDVCIVSSLYPLRSRRSHFYDQGDPWPKTLIYDLLKPAGYSTAIISSQDEGWAGMYSFLESPNLDLFLDAERREPGSRIARRDGVLRSGSMDDAATTDKAISWITDQVEKDFPFFLAMNFQNSHFPYDISPGAPKPFHPGTIDFETSFFQYSKDKVEVIRNAYYNSLHETDRQIGRLVDTLRNLGRLENTILVIYGENGEAFHEKGYVTHAGDPIEPAIHVACIFFSPRYLTSRAEPYPVELIDITPTVLGLMGWATHPNFQGIDFLDPNRPPLDRRLLFIHNETAISRTDAVLLAGRYKYIIDRESGDEFVYDLEKDPAEEVNLFDRSSPLLILLRETHRKWRKRQLAYYHFPAYYRHYYPPRPPGITVEEAIEAVFPGKLDHGAGRASRDGGARSERRRGIP